MGKKSSKMFLSLYCVLLNCFITNLPQGEESARPDGITASWTLQTKHRSFFYKSMETKITLPKPHAPNLSYLPLIILINDKQNPPLNTVPCDFLENTARTSQANFVTIKPICKQTFRCSVPAWGGTVCLLRIDTPTRSKVS